MYIWFLWKTRSKNGNTVVEAIMQLAKYQRKSCAKRLGRILLNTDYRYDARAQAAKSLGKMNIIFDDTVITPLVAGLVDGDHQVRTAALESLESLNWEPNTSEERAKCALASKKWKDLESIGEKAINSLRQLIKNAVTNKNLTDVGMATKILAEIDGGKTTIGLLVSILECQLWNYSENYIEERARTIEALGQTKNSDAIPLLLDFLAVGEDIDEGKLCRHAATALKEFPQDQVSAAGVNLVQPLIESLWRCATNYIEYSRREYRAIISLGAIGDTRAVEVLTRILKNPYITNKLTNLETVRETVINALGNIRSIEALYACVECYLWKSDPLFPLSNKTISSSNYILNAINSHTHKSSEYWPEFVKSIARRLEYRGPWTTSNLLALLEALDWSPSDDRDLANIYIATGKFNAAAKLGSSGVIPLAECSLTRRRPAGDDSPNSTKEALGALKSIPGQEWLRPIIDAHYGFSTDLERLLAVFKEIGGSQEPQAIELLIPLASSLNCRYYDRQYKEEHPASLMWSSLHSLSNRLLSKLSISALVDMSALPPDFSYEVWVIDDCDLGNTKTNQVYCDRIADIARKELGRRDVNIYELLPAVDFQDMDRIFWLAKS